jgi:hypothetical protein
LQILWISFDIIGFNVISKGKEREDSAKKDKQIIFDIRILIDDYKDQFEAEGYFWNS